MKGSKVSLRGKQFLTLGSKGSGKSYLNSRFAERATGKVAIFDPMDEYPDGEEIIKVIPENRRGEGAIQELRDVIDFVQYNSNEINYFIVDEISRYHSKGGILDDALGELIDLNRHMDMGIGFIARRPTQVHTDVREMSDYMFLFKLPGVNDRKMLDNISAGLEQEMNELIEHREEHSFITVYPDRGYETVDPISW